MARPPLKAYVGHVGFKLATLTIGAIYVARPVARLRRRWRGRSETAFSGRTALVAHVFYPDLLGEIRDCFDCFPVGSDLLLTTPTEKAASVEALFAGRPDVRVIPVENRGRDIAPFVLLLNRGMLDPYDAVLKLHTKKSPHLRDGDIRRRLLYAMLAGSPRRVGEVLDLFQRPTTGLVGWRLAWRRSPIFWMGNRRRVEALAKRMHLPPPITPAFFEGSMFWVRPAALFCLKKLDLAVEDFEPEARQLDGALHHAIERVFQMVVQDGGCETLDISGRSLS